MQPNNAPFRFTPQLVLGIIIITVGVLFTLDNLDLLNAREYLRYWPALLILFGASKIFHSQRGGKVFGFVLVVGGSLMLLDRMYYIDFNWGDFWPLIFIAIGGSMLWNSMSRKRNRQSLEGASSESDATVNHFTMMGGVHRVISSKDFQGGELTAVMGGIEIDLRQAAIKDGEAEIEVFAFWGGIVLKVPTTWAVVVQATPIMGGVDDKTQPPTGDVTQRLIIKGNMVMGGMEIYN